jgi:hypothetical protein
MDATSKRRWYQFSLRALLIGVTVTSILCGWVANYRFRMASAAGHEEKAMWCRIGSKYSIRGMVDAETGALMDRHTAESLREAVEHEHLAEAYRQAAWQPWIVIRETPAP